MLSRRLQLVFVSALVVAALAAVVGVRSGRLALAAGPAGPDGPAALAAIPSTFNYQGTLRLADGSLANDSFNITLKIYDAAVGGNVLHSESFSNVAVRDGQFKVVVGDSVAIGPTVFSDAPRFVGITVAPDPEMVPRQRLHPVPWAQQATSAVTSTTLVPGATVNNLRVQGNLGIGTLNPGAGLHVDKGATNDYAIRATSSGPGWGSGILFENTAARKWGIYSGADGQLSIADLTGNRIHTQFMPNGGIYVPEHIIAEVLLQSNGDVRAGGKVYAARGFNGFCGVVTGGDLVSCNQDVAETFASAEPTEPGDLVVLVAPPVDGGLGGSRPTVRRTMGANEAGLVGVVSTNPGLVFDQGQTYLAGENTNLITADKTVVAMIGRVPVKVSLENGPIAVGDPLTSGSAPGVAMKATQAGQILGYAMQSSDEMRDGKLLAWLQVGYYMPSQLVSALNDGTTSAQAMAALTEQNSQLAQQVAALQTQNATSQEQLATMNARLAALERGGQSASWPMSLPLVGGLVVVGLLAAARGRRIL